MVFTTDLTKAELRVIELFLPETYLSRRPSRWSKHQILRDILSVCKWLQASRFTLIPFLFIDAQNKPYKKHQ
jgi:hypothetical protein